MRNSSITKQLTVELFESVLSGDEDQIKKLVRRGADPNYHVGDLVDGILRNELKIKTAHQLAHSLKQENILRIFAARGNNSGLCPGNRSRKNRRSKGDTAKKMSAIAKLNGIQTAQPPLPIKSDITPNTEGYVYILNYSSFKKQSIYDIKNADAEAHQLLDSFKKIGYSGVVHSSLTETETREALETVKDLKGLKEGQCVVFIIRGYAPYHTSAYTSDGKLLHFNEIIGKITDSSNPDIKHLRKLFIFYIKRWFITVCDPVPDDAYNANNFKQEYKPKENCTIASLYFEPESKWPKSSSGFPSDPISFNDAVIDNIQSHRMETSDLQELYKKLYDADRSNW